MVLYTGAATLALLVTTILPVYKLRGLTRHGQNFSNRQQALIRWAKGANPGCPRRRPQTPQLMAPCPNPAKLDSYRSVQGCSPGQPLKL